ncbi:MAG TPA: YciI family protein [Rugosimonospora sp.]
MKYVLMLCSDATVAAHVFDEGIAAGCAGWTEEMQRRGVLTNATGLRPPDEAATVKVRDGDVLRTDGPFAETKDQIGGFAMIECGDLEEAVALASQHPWARAGQIEVRPVWEP